MSHVTQIEIKVKSLEALKAACQRLGLEWLEGQKTYKWYGRHVGDYPIPEGLTVDDMGKCTHAIKVPGASYEIGVLDRGNGAFQLLWDFWSGGGLERVLGKGGGKLKQAYALEVAKVQARRAGYSCIERVEEDGQTITLTMARRA